MTDALVFVLISLASYRLFRLVALDTLPPLARLRTWGEVKITAHFSDAWADGITCPWCAGAWTTAIVVVVTDLFASVPLPGLQWAAAGTVVGLIGSNLDG